MPSYTLSDIKDARERVRADMVAEYNEMYGTNYLTSKHLNGLEIEARLQTYLRFGLSVDELEPVASEEPESTSSVIPPTSDTTEQEPNHG